MSHNEKQNSNPPGHAHVIEAFRVQSTVALYRRLNDAHTELAAVLESNELPAAQRGRVAKAAAMMNYEAGQVARLRLLEILEAALEYPAEGSLDHAAISGAIACARTQMVYPGDVAEADPVGFLTAAAKDAQSKGYDQVGFLLLATREVAVRQPLWFMH